MTPSLGLISLLWGGLFQQFFFNLDHSVIFVEATHTILVSWKPISEFDGSCGFHFQYWTTLHMKLDAFANKASWFHQFKKKKLTPSQANCFLLNCPKKSMFSGGNIISARDWIFIEQFLGRTRPTIAHYLDNLVL